MDYLLAIMTAFLCLYLVARLLKPRDITDIQMAVVGVFSIGYYCLPIFFKELSTLNYFGDNDIASAQLIHSAFLLFVVIGTEIQRKIGSKNTRIETKILDYLIYRKRFTISIFCFAIYIYYYMSQDLTSYTSENFEAYFSDRNPLIGLISSISGLSLAFLAFSVALSWRDNRRTELLFGGAMLATCVFLSLFLGQRLALLTPIVTFLAALALTSQFKRAVSVLVIGVAALLLVSPVAVFLRETLSDRRTDAQTALSSFSYGDDAWGEIFQSILDRGDLLDVTIRMKPYIDQSELPGPIYYLSVLAGPVPRILLPNKPYLLSTNGQPNGELSILAWETLKGGTGSLSAFGGIVAYREGSWPGVLANGLATGMLFVFLGRWMGGGGLVSRVFFAQIFVGISIAKVPPSFFEALARVLPMLAILLVLFFLNNFLASFRRTKQLGNDSGSIDTTSAVLSSERK